MRCTLLNISLRKRKMPHVALLMLKAACKDLESIVLPKHIAAPRPKQASTQGGGGRIKSSGPSEVPSIGDPPEKQISLMHHWLALEEKQEEKRGTFGGRQLQKAFIG